MKDQIQIYLLTLCFFSIAVCNAQTNERSSADFKSNRTEREITNFSDKPVNKSINSLKNVTPDSPETDAIVQTDFNGFDAGSFYGSSASGAGDLNGDGLSDFIVGAQNYNTSQGRAYIYFGKTNMTNVPDLILTGQNVSDYFATSVSGAGDVNGDGYSDVIVGAPGYNNSTGRAYIYFGGANMNNVADVTLSGVNINDNFGNSVASAGDVNGDGFSDVIAAAYWFNNLTGRAYIYYGGANMNNVSDVILTGETASSQFGVTVACAGDVNGDGYSDIISGADAYNSGTGKAYIFFGGNPMNNTVDITLNGGAIYDGFGHSVSGIGDINGDSYSDFIIGAALNDSGGVNSGRAYVYFGGAIVDSIADYTFTGSSNNFFGGNVSGAGDVNGDGYSDFLISATGENNNTGTVYIVMGGIYISNYIILNGTNSGDFFGSSATGCGDINGDGNSDVIAGSPFCNSNTGRVILYMKSVSGTANANFTMTGAGGNAYFARSVSAAGDVNGDGYPDLIAGSPTGYGNSGVAYIYFSGAAMDTLVDVTLNGDGLYNNFGSSVSSAGDVNGDGFSDVIVGAYGYNQNKGRAYIFYGGISMDNLPDVMLDGELTGDFFASSVSKAGDVNGDGYSDVIAGAWFNNSGTGKAYIFYGGVSMNNTADVIISGGTFHDELGRSVSSAGDVNGDGYSDVIAGADGYSSETGRAYIYYGGNVMNNIADVIITGEGTQNVFGYSVSFAGDLNEDGFSDVIVGAPWYGSHKGRAYIYYGGISMNNVSDVILTGNFNGEELGHSVSGAGDLNNDGYSDVITGASQCNASTGSVYIFYGGAVMNNIEDITLKGETFLNYFGSSVSGAGDLNLDGYSDVIVGADGYYSRTGRAYVYLSPSKNISVNLTAFIQGFFNQTTSTQVSDTLKVYLRNTSAPYNTVDSAKAILNSNGASSLNFTHAASGNYYLVFKHRNSLETWSKSGGEAMTKGYLSTYNFTNAKSKAYGNNMILKGNKYCIYSGDVTQDGYIDLTDINLIFNDAGNFTTGYKKTDLTGDSITDLTDLLIAFNNSSGFVSVLKP